MFLLKFCRQNGLPSEKVELIVSIENNSNTGIIREIYLADKGCFLAKHGEDALTVEPSSFPRMT